MRERHAERFAHYLRRGRRAQELAAPARCGAGPAEVPSRGLQRDLSAREPRAGGLHRGRILVTNLHDEPAIVRVRFENSSLPGGPPTYWIVTLVGKNARHKVAKIGRVLIVPRVQLPSYSIKHR